MKKFLAILTCFVLIFTLAACGASAPKETAAADAAAPAEAWDGGSYDMVEESENGVFQPASGIPDAAKRDAKSSILPIWIWRPRRSIKRYRTLPQRWNVSTATLQIVLKIAIMPDIAMLIMP